MAQIIAPKALQDNLSWRVGQILLCNDLDIDGRVLLSKNDCHLNGVVDLIKQLFLRQIRSMRYIIAQIPDLPHRDAKQGAVWIW